MPGLSCPNNISTKLKRIAEVSKSRPAMCWTTVGHHIDEKLLKEAFRHVRKGSAPGVDGQTAADFASNLDDNVRRLNERFHHGTYRAPAVRRVEIPKGKGDTRPIGIPTVADKVLQRAVAMVLNAVYEQDFLDCSYGFRPGRSAHQALDALRSHLMTMRGGWVIDLDIKSFYDSLNHSHLRAFLDKRMRDGKLRRVIDKWLKAGVLKDGTMSYPEDGTPQGGVVSPLLANIFRAPGEGAWI